MGPPSGEAFLPLPCGLPPAPEAGCKGHTSPQNLGPPDVLTEEGGGQPCGQRPPTPTACDPERVSST